MTSERSREPRASRRASVGLQPSARHRLYSGYSVDTSRGGSLIRGPIPLEAGSGLELRIDLGELTLAPVEGRDKGCNPCPVEDHPFNS
ncbi:MAG: PilZ domain-containing protein [Vulcanimicrobiota bacterium]